MYRFTNNLRTRIVNEKRGCQKREYTVRYHCTHCSKGVWARSRAISCDSCEPWIHTNCAGVLSDSLYDQLCSSVDDFTFECDQCSIHALSFPDGSTYDDTRDRSRILISSALNQKALTSRILGACCHCICHCPNNILFGSAWSHKLLQWLPFLPCNAV